MALSKMIALPISLALGAILVYVYLLDNPEYSSWIIAPIILLAALYTVHGEIDRRWRRSHPRPVPQALQLACKKWFPMMDSFSQSQHQSFFQHLDFGIAELEIEPQGFKTVPPEVLAGISGQIALLKVLKPAAAKALHDYVKIILYQHPFPSPQYKEHLHASELYIPDHVTIFCIDHVIKSLQSPSQFMRVVLYEFCKVILMVEDLPGQSLTPDQLAEISGFSPENVIAYVGLPKEMIDYSALTCSYFIDYTARYKEVAPDQYRHMTEFFAIQPLPAAVG